MQHDSKLIRDLVNMMDPTSPLAITPNRYEGRKNIPWWSSGVSGYSGGGGGGGGGGGDGGGGRNPSVSRKRAALKKSRSKQKRTGRKVAKKTIPS